jgi:drug/metabolite transporter (DMT)-like permease
MFQTGADLIDDVLLVVLGAALLHALWNAMIRHSHDKPMYTLSLHLCSAAIALPVLMVVGLPDPASYPFLLTSICLHGVYIHLLAKVYASGPFVLSYILMRGTAPMVVLLITFWYLDAGMSASVMLGMAVLAGGIFSVLYAHDRSPMRHLRSVPLRWAMVNALIIAAYTVVDGLGARAAGNPLSYVFASALFEPLLVYWFGFRRQTAQLKVFFIRHMRLIVMGSVISLSGYSMVLWAMTQAPIAVVSSLRETSVIFAAVIAVLWFREGRWKPVVMSSVLVFIGIFLLKV